MKRKKFIVVAVLIVILSKVNFADEVYKHQPEASLNINSSKVIENITSEIATVSYIDFFDESITRYEDQNGKWGYIDIEGNIVVKATFDYGTRFHYGKAKVVENNKIYIINQKGDKVAKINLTFDPKLLDLGMNNIELFLNSNISLEGEIIRLKDKDGNIGISDLSGNMLIPFMNLNESSNNQVFYKKLDELRSGMGEINLIDPNYVSPFPIISKDTTMTEDYKNIYAIRKGSKGGFAFAEYKNSPGFSGDEAKFISKEVYPKIDSISSSSYSHRYFLAFNEEGKMPAGGIVFDGVNKEEQYSPFNIFDYNGNILSKDEYIIMTKPYDFGLSIAKKYGENELDIIDFKKGAQIIKTIKEEKKICYIFSDKISLRYLIKNDNNTYTCVVINYKGEEIARYNNPLKGGMSLYN